MFPSSYYSTPAPAPISNNSALGPQTHIRRSCVPHSSLLPHVQCTIHHIVRPRLRPFDFFGKSDEENELRVTAMVYGFGIPLHCHATASSTHVGTLDAVDGPRPIIQLFSEREARDIAPTTSPHREAIGYKPKNVYWREPLRLPIRWKDMTRDGCITFSVVGPCGEQMFGTTLPIFNSTGLLRTGKQKLRLYRGKKAQPYIGPNFCKTPGLPPAGKVEDYDVTWKAQMVMEDIEKRQKRIQAMAEKQEASTPRQGTPIAVKKKTYWLDNLTMQRCREILSSSDNPTDDNDEEELTEEQEELAFLSTLDQEDPRYLLATESYLIVELPEFPLPVVHEETFYPHATHGASGSVTALDLSLHKRRVAALSMIEKSIGLNKQTPQTALLRSKVAEEEDAGLSLVQFLDPENVDDNPVEDKHRALAHDLIRGLVDPSIKPDKQQRAKIASIIASPSHHLTREEKDLLWRFRFSLVDNRKALTKFLLAVEWNEESEVVQAAELLEQWRKRSPIAVTDALKMLGKDVAFQTSLVRAYAIETLATAPDEELQLYLLQLVQALKYEEITLDDMIGKRTESGVRFKAPVSLANFLIERAAKSLTLANYLYWYIKVEMEDATHGERYAIVFSSLRRRLTHVFNYKSMTMWDRLLMQDQFITGIMKCQMEGREERGRKDAKEKKLKELLVERGFHRVKDNHSVPLPSEPHIMVSGLNASATFMFKSAMYPAVMEFRVAEETSEGGAAFAHVEGDEKKSKNLSTYKVLLKTGDDLRQDQLVMMLVRLMDGLLKRGTLNLCLRPYSILATSPTSGLVEFVSGSIPISQILASNNNSILQYFQKVAPSKTAAYNVHSEVLNIYIRSCAGYCVITYLLGVGDRHLDNIMLLPTGHFFHIDFGFIFGRDPKPLPPPFRITREMVDGMGGLDSQGYKKFCSFSCQAFNILRKNAGLVLNLLHLMSNAGIEDLSNNPTADAEGVIAKVADRFRLELTDEQAETFFLGLINESLAAFAPRVMEVFHQISVARR